MEDKKIVQMLWDRLEQALDALAKKFGRRLLYTAMNILGNPQDAEEAVNDTYMALWNTIPPERPDPLGGYVHRTGRNVALKKYRYLTAAKRSTQYDISLEELSGILPGPSMEETLDARELGRAIDRFLDTISKDNRILFLRRYWFGDSVKALAKAFSMSENTVSVRLSRLRSQLKDYLYKEGLFYEA
jgi:RNA polymerase sigma-70 factor (ECF subfamily)